MRIVVDAYPNSMRVFPDGASPRKYCSRHDACILGLREHPGDGTTRVAHGGANAGCIGPPRMVGTAGRGACALNGTGRIAVVRALHGLGDMLCAVPALRALRRAHPAADIALIGLPECRWMIERFGRLLDGLLPFPGFPGIPERPFAATALERFVRSVRRAPFDLALQMHGSGRVSNAFTALLGARAAAGFYDASRQERYGARFFPYPERQAEVHRWLTLTKALGYPSRDDRLEFPMTDEDRAALREHGALAGLERGSFVCIHPGARDPARRWPPERFSAVANVLAGRGFRVVLTGTHAERPAADAVAAAMKRRALNVAGETSLGALAALLERAALLVGNDTGVSHLAAALRVPSVIVFLRSDPERWAPSDLARHRPIVGRHLARAGRGRLARMRIARTDMPEAAEVLEEATMLLNGVYGG